MKHFRITLLAIPLMASTQFALADSPGQTPTWEGGSAAGLNYTGPPPGSPSPGSWNPAPTPAPTVRPSSPSTVPSTGPGTTSNSTDTPPNTTNTNQSPFTTAGIPPTTTVENTPWVDQEAGPNATLVSTGGSEVLSSITSTAPVADSGTISNTTVTTTTTQTPVAPTDMVGGTPVEITPLEREEFTSNATLANTGGSPALMSLAGLTLAALAFGLRRKISA